MKKFDMKLLGIILSFLVVLYLAYDFKNRLDKLNNEYYEMTQHINQIRYNWHNHKDILEESIIFLRYNNDNIMNHLKYAKDYIQEVNHKENLKKNYPLVYKDLVNLMYESNIVRANTFKFIRANAKIKNSLFILEKHLNDIDNYEKVYSEKYIEAVTKFMSIKNNFDQDNNIDYEMYKFFESYKDKNEQYNLNFMHIKLLFEELSYFKKLFNDISESRVNHIVENMYKNLDRESSTLKENMKDLFLVILFAYVVFFFVILYFNLKIKTDTLKIIELEKQKNFDSRLDKLTGLLNRTAFVEDTKELKNFSVVLFDITDFSNINSVVGYRGGDYILKEVAYKLSNIDKSEVKSRYTYRIGGDHFAIILKMENEDLIKSLVLEIIDKIEESIFEYESLELPVYLQAGVSNQAPYLRNAEMAIKKTKNSFEKISFYTEEKDIKKNSIENTNMLIKVKEALKSNRIRPFFQPIVDLKTKKIVKCESLVRLINDDGKVIVPYFFLELTKKSKLYPSITKIVIDKSIEFIRQENIEVSINISYQDIKDKTSMDYISVVLKENQDIASYITFELLESDEIENYEEIMEFIKIIKSNGCKLAIDDFGSGYSNFNHLFNMKPDILKLDGTLIKDINTNKNSKNIVKAMVMLAKESGIQTVAEFVDNQDVDELITNIGLDFGQGYYYSPPQDLLKKS